MLNAVMGLNNIASTLGGEKGQNTSKNSAKSSKGDFTEGKIIFLTLTVYQVGDTNHVYRNP